MAHPPHSNPDPHTSDNTDLSAVPTDPAQESLVSALRSSFNVLRVVMIVLVVLYLFSGIVRVEPGEQGLIVRFGTLRVNDDPESPYANTPIFAPGWHFALPDPFDEKITISGETTEQKIYTFMFNVADQNQRDLPLTELSARGRGLTPGIDGALLTGDKNLSHGRFTVQYRVTSADAFVRNIAESPDAPSFQRLLQRLTETAVVREVASRRVEDVTRRAIADVRKGIKGRLQASLDEFDTGVTVVEVIAETIEPKSVRQAFLRVVEAENERKEFEERARQEAATILNQAAGTAHQTLLDAIQAYGAARLADASPERLAELRNRIDEELERAAENKYGRVAVLLDEAQSAANETRETVRREYEEFQYYLDQYRKFPQETVLGLWNFMREDVLGSSQNEIFYVPATDEIEILVDRDPRKAQEAAREYFQKLQENR